MPFQVFFKSLIWFWKKKKKDEQYVCLLLFKSVASIFPKGLYLVWALFFKVGSFNLMNFTRNLFFIEIDIWRPS